MDRQRRQWLGWAWATGMAAASAMPSLTRANTSAQPVTVALTAQNSYYHLPVMLAERLGFFRQQGLQVSLLTHDSGAAGLASVLQGKAEVLAGAFEHVFELQRRGQAFQAFVQMADTPMLSLGVSTLRPAPRSWQDLRSARIGISALESSTHWTSLQWLLRNGLRPDDVRFVEVGTSSGALGALWDGHIDALCNPDPLMHWLEMRNDIRLIAEARSHGGTRLMAGGALPGGCLMARESFLQRQPALAGALVDALVQALRWLQTAGPTDLFRVVPVAPWMADRGVYLGALDKLRDAFSRDGRIHQEAVFNAWRMHARVSAQLPIPSDRLSRLYTNAYLLRGRARGAHWPGGQAAG